MAKPRGRLHFESFMNKTLRQFFILLALLAGINRMAAQGTTAFTYQGQLRDGGTNANGTYTMIFKLYDASTNGNQISTAITNSLGLFNGLFSVNLDFGAGALNGSARWLDITVTNGPVTQTLWPRVQVLPSPYAEFAAIAATVTNGAIMNAQLAANAVATTNIQNGAITTAQIASGAVTNANLTANAVATANIQNNAVTTAQIADGAVINRNLAANAVNAANIASGQVVKSINGLTDNVILSLIGILTAGANTALFTNGNTLQMSALVPNVQVFITNGTFIVPSNVTRIKVDLWGGGGGGGKGNNSGYNGGGGGAGGYAFNVLNVVPGTNYPVTVGIGGTNGVAGTFSSFSNLVSATGGGAGTNAVSNANGGGGIGGTTTNSIVSFGVSGATTNSIVLFAGSAGAVGGSFGGGNGASALGSLGSVGGLGGVSPNGTASGAGGNANGPGAGGGGSSAGQNPAPGGTGGPGLVIVYY
jgi:hypothetical protein